MSVNRGGPQRTPSLPALFTGWIVASVGLAVLAVGLWSVMLHGSLLDFLQDDRQSRTQLESIASYGLTFSIAGVALLAVAAVIMIIAFRTRRKRRQ